MVVHAYADADADADGVLTYDDHAIWFRIGFSDGFPIAYVLRELPDTTHFAAFAVDTTTSPPTGRFDDFTRLTDITTFACGASVTHAVQLGFGYIGHVNSEDDDDDEAHGQDEGKGRINDFTCFGFVGEST
jgi:hypothetical protein